MNDRIVERKTRKPFCEQARKELNWWGSIFNRPSVWVVYFAGGYLGTSTTTTTTKLSTSSNCIDDLFGMAARWVMELDSLDVDVVRIGTFTPNQLTNLFYLGTKQHSQVSSLELYVRLPDDVSVYATQSRVDSCLLLDHGGPTSRSRSRPSWIEVALFYTATK